VRLLARDLHSQFGSNVAKIGRVDDTPAAFLGGGESRLYGQFQDVCATGHV
jgi:hypothetical protein